MKKSLKIGGMVALLLVGLSIEVCAGPESEKDMPDWMRERLEMTITAQTPIEFYGKVVDLDGKPLGGATVVLQATSYTASFPATDPYVQGTTVSGPEGLFEVGPATFKRMTLKGASLSIETIKKEGYQFSRHRNPADFFEYRSDYTACHKPDKTKPVVFRLRKRGELTYVLDYATSGYRRAVGSPDAPKRYLVNLIEDHRNEPYRDMEIALERDAEGKAWTVTFKMLDEGAGVLMSKERLYTVPEEGYQPEWAITIPVRERQPAPQFFLAIRSRNPAIYALGDVMVPVSAKEGMVQFNIQVNPYGERNFEYKKDDIPWRLEERLKAEALKALSEGRLAPKPDLPKLIKEYRDTP